MEGANPAFDQDAFRGRNDDGSESAATFKENANVDWIQNVDENFRVRFVIQETAGVASSNFQEQLEYNLGGAGWNSVTDVSAVVRAFASTNFADRDDTTQQVGAGTFLTANDAMDEVDGVGSNMLPDFVGNDEFECEFCVQIISGDVVDADTIQLRITQAGTILDTYTNTPTVTVSEAAAARRIFVVT